MTKEELTANLGTLAKSGTTEFLSKSENSELDAQGQGNLIGAFGVIKVRPCCFSLPRLVVR